MSKLYGKALAESIRDTIARIEEALDDRNERISQGMTDIDDCFISERVERRAIQEARMQLDILRSDGTMPIDAVIDENGDEVYVRYVDTRYGPKYVGNGVFASSLKALLKKTGWKTEERNVPCWTKFIPGSGGGMYSVYTGTVGIVRWHTNMVTGEYAGFPE
ncbi:MAG: hypothetical protein LBS45_12210 [Synergistaceae bacterium]|jgi:hypothetical protein|nr:hypothetical protein [Synergistaceae bacterium]